MQETVTTMHSKKSMYGSYALWQCPQAATERATTDNSRMQRLHFVRFFALAGIGVDRLSAYPPRWVRSQRRRQLSFLSCIQFIALFFSLLFNF